MGYVVDMNKSQTFAVIRRNGTAYTRLRSQVESYRQWVPILYPIA